jgi:methionyl-tRNA formyltransferase
MPKLRVVFCGTPKFALPCLDALWESSQIELLAVYTQPDRPAGRSRQLQCSAVKQWALQRKLPIFQPKNFKEPTELQQLAALQPDVIVVIAYGMLLPSSVLALPPFGCINVHASLLPRWRGASPIQQAILHGDQHTGVTIMQMERGLDTGPSLMIAKINIADDETTVSLHDKLAFLAIEPLFKTLEQLAHGGVRQSPQDANQATYAPKINKNDAHIDWSEPAVVIERKIRAFLPWPIAFTYAASTLMRIYTADIVRDGGVHDSCGKVHCIDQRGMIVATGQDNLRIKTLQFAGGKVMTVCDWLNAGRANSLIGCVLT